MAAGVVLGKLLRVVSLRVHCSEYNAAAVIVSGLLLVCLWRGCSSKNCEWPAAGHNADIIVQERVGFPHRRVSQCNAVRDMTMSGLVLPLRVLSGLRLARC